MPILSGLRSKPKKLNFSKTMEEIKDTTLKSLYNDLQEKISPKSSATTLIATLEKLYKTFMGVQKTKVGAAIDLPDAVVFVQLFPSLFQTIIDKQEASQFHDKVMGLAVNVQEIVWKQYEYEKLKRAVSLFMHKFSIVLYIIIIRAWTIYFFQLATYGLLWKNLLRRARWSVQLYLQCNILNLIAVTVY